LGDAETGTVATQTNPVGVDIGNQSELGIAGKRTAMTSAWQVGLWACSNARGSQGETWRDWHHADNAWVYG